MSRLLTAAGAPIRSGTTTISTPRFHDLLAWDNSWDVLDATLYTPSAGEQTEYGVSATPRIATVPDRGTANKPLSRDTGGYAPYSSPAGTLPLPGPQYIAESERFRGRPAARFAVLTPGQYPILTPQATIGDTSQYFNATGGYTAPYWIAMLVRVKGISTAVDCPWDSQLGSSDAGPTVTAGVQTGGAGNWSCSLWQNMSPTNTITSSIAPSTDHTVLIIVSVVSGASNSSFQVYRRLNPSNQLVGASTTGTFNAFALREMFMGWHHDHYFMVAGIRDAAITVQNVADVINWAGPWMPAPHAVASEP